MLDNIQEVSLHFVHPKLIDRTFRARSIDVLGQIRQLISENTLLNLFSNYHFQQKSQKLSELEPIGNILNHQLPIDVVLDVYNQITAKYHFNTVVNILHNPNIYLYIIKTNAGQQIRHGGSVDESSGQIRLDFQSIIDANFNNQLITTSKKSMMDQLINFISLSGFNPPPTYQKFNGDLFYLHVRTLQCIDYHITATPRGFYINQSKISHFNPTISNNHKTIYINLIDLLKTISQKFKHHLDEYISHSLLSETQLYALQTIRRFNPTKWLDTNQLQHSWNAKKLIELDHKTQKVGLKDWNEMFQLRNQTSFGKADLFIQYKFFSKLYSQFEEAAVEGSKALIDGKIPPLNPMDETKKHIYIYDNIFYSIANETPFNHSQEKGQDATPSVSAINTDLINLSILQSLCIPNLHVLHMIVVSYRGFKIIAQCIIPGILTGDHANCSQYGSIDDGKTIQNNIEFEKLMIQVCEKLHLENSVQVKDGEGNVKTIAGSPDVKGILGSDGRKYILDLLRLSPRDLNYLGPENEVCVIRPQLIKAFLNTKDKHSLPTINTNVGTEISFIPNDNIKQQEQLLKQISKYIKDTAVPQLINALNSTLNIHLTDSKGISFAFHQYGVNLRYLGYVCDHQLLHNNKEIRTVLTRVILARSLKHLFRMAMRETNILYLNETITRLLNSIFGCKNHIALLEEGVNINQGITEPIQTKKKKKKKNKVEKEDDVEEIVETNPIKVPISPYLLMKPSQLWDLLRKISKCRYQFQLPKSIHEFELFKLPCQKLAALRDLCLSTGLKLQKKKYNIVHQNQQLEKGLPFNIKNITDISAIPKRKQVSMGRISETIKEADAHVDKYQMKQALLKFNKCSEQIMALTGGLVPELAYVRTRMAKIFYLLGEHDSAIMAQSSGQKIIEALESEDSPRAVQSYATLGLYYSTKGDKSKAIHLISKSISLMLISFGQTHPDFLINMSNLARIYHQEHQYQKSTELYLKAIEFLSGVNGKENLKVSFCYSSLASLHLQMGDYNNAIRYQSETVAILSKILAENDVRLADANKILKIYKQVGLNKMMNNNLQEKEKQDAKKKKQNKK